MKSVFSKRSFIESLARVEETELSSASGNSAGDSMKAKLEKALFAFGPRLVNSFVSMTLVLTFVASVAVGLTGCVTYMPIDEYNLARVAYEAAKDSDAARYAPALWFSTEQAYREGQKAFDDRDYGSAHRLFNSTREYAERAENAARYARHQSGDVVP